MSNEKMECYLYFNRSGYRDGFHERVYQPGVHEHAPGDTNTTPHRLWDGARISCPDTSTCCTHEHGSGGTNTPPHRL
jgi:hypothetical protein